jgi:hypothetical protein
MNLVAFCARIHWARGLKRTLKRLKISQKQHLGAKLAPPTAQNRSNLAVFTHQIRLLTNKYGRKQLLNQ